MMIIIITSQIGDFAVLADHTETEGKRKER